MLKATWWALYLEFHSGCPQGELKCTVSDRGQWRTWVEAAPHRGPARGCPAAPRPPGRAPSLPGEGTARLASDSPPETARVLPSCPLPPMPPLRLLRGPSAPSGCLSDTDVCVSVLLGDCFLIMLWNNSTSGLVTLPGSTDELAVTSTGAAPRREPLKRLASSWRPYGATSVLWAQSAGFLRRGGWRRFHPAHSWFRFPNVVKRAF